MGSEYEHLVCENDISGQKVQLKSLLCAAPAVALKLSAPDNTIVTNLYLKRLQNEKNLALFFQQIGFQGMSFNLGDCKYVMLVLLFEC